MNRTILAFILTLCGLVNATASPSKIAPALNETLIARPDSFVSAIVYLEIQADISSLDMELTRRRATRADRHRIVIEELQRTATASQTDLLSTLDSYRRTGRVAGYTPYWITNCVVVRAIPRVLEEISDRSDVQWIDVNFTVELIEPIRPARDHGGSRLDENHGVPRGIRAIRAPDVWYQLGYAGEGRLVGNLDTGVEGGHPALAARWRGNFAPAQHCWLDVLGQTSFPEDRNGHGTHVMGTMCGNSLITNDSVGVAPHAQWIACNAIDQSVGEEINNDILTGFQWFADPDGNAVTIEDVPDVIQNSWSVSARFPGYQDCFNLWNNAIINCEAAAIVVVFSAGNSGPGSQSCGSPATVAMDSVTMFAVGAVDATNDTIPPYDIATFSSRGPSDCPPGTAIKPEVCAPGVDVYSSYSSTGYDWLDGTSMAGPHVAGIVALIRQASPDAEVREIKSVLMRSAHDYGAAGEDNTYGFGFVDAYAAVSMILVGRGFVMGTVTEVPSGNPIAGALIEAVGAGRGVRTRSDGSYFITLRGDTTWTLRYSAFGYVTTEHSVAVAVGDTTLRNAQLTSSPRGTLRGTVRAGNSVPVTEALVTFISVPVNPIMTDSLGRYSAELPGDALYHVRTDYHDALADTTVELPSGQTLDVNLYLASPRAAPTMPDAYGYRAFDRLDTGYAATFDWLEIAPSLGGAGTLIELPARDSSGWVGLPFRFQYYGVGFDSLTINENGWIAGGISHDHSYFNFPIPGLAGPSAMLAPFWDNLHDGAVAEICCFSDTLRGRFVIEYSNLEFPPSSQRVTFQVQIFSPDARPTPTGDCEIVFLYRRVDVPNQSSVGIENPAETAGLQLLYNGTFDSRTWLIGPRAAVRFTTRTHGRTGTLTGRIIAHPPETDLTQATVHVGESSVSPNASGQFSANSLLTGVHRPCVTLAGFETVRAEILIGADSTSNLELRLWRLDPPRNLTATTASLPLVPLRWESPLSAVAPHGLDEFSEYVVYRNGIALTAVADTFYTDTLITTGFYSYYVVAAYDGGLSGSSNQVAVEYSSGIAEEIASLPTEFTLRPCYPNPFNPSTTVRFGMPSAAEVRIEVFDVLGRRVTTLAEETFRPGWHDVIWDCRSCPTGMYVLRLQTGEKVLLGKMLLMK